MDKIKLELPHNKLRWECNPDIFEFESTKGIPPLGQFIGQDRAIKAIDFGLSMQFDGYNIYVAGLTGTGKTSAVKTHINKLLEEKRAREQVKPVFDWCYLYNFTDPDRPEIVSLSPGKGKNLNNRIISLLKQLKEALAKEFSSEDYKNRRKLIIEENQSEQRRIIDELRDETQRRGFIAQVTPAGQMLIPVRNGKPMTQEEYLELDEQTRSDLDNKRNELIKVVESELEKAREQERKAATKLQELDKSIADITVSRLFSSLIDDHRKSEVISKYLANLKDYTLNNSDIFKVKEEQPDNIPALSTTYLLQGRDPFLPFQINVFVDNGKLKGPPVIIESNPNYANLFGKIERRFLFGGYLSDHTMLKPGALHLANGGYLLLNATDVLTNPAVWPALKRTIKNKEVTIEEPYEQFGLFAPHGLKPRPMPVDVKILLIGDTALYQILSIYDEDFWEIFKVKADFDSRIERNKENMLHIASFISSCCEHKDMIHFHKTGVAKVMENAARIVDDQDKLTSRFALIQEIVQESEYWAKKDAAELVYGEHVEKAIEEKIYRHNLTDEHVRELIMQGIIMVDTEGAVVGQVNGLSIYAMGDISFGKPSRITCKTYLGRGGVINIERESQLSGKIHDKGVLILSGYLGWKYAQRYPLSVSASLCFEQSYEGVEGDSASSAELYALLSSLSDMPIKQNLAVTGSVNQKGEIQPIGGVNYKIEGFFQICKSKGLTGDQGVIIPFQNIKNLMLRRDVVDAVKENKFHIYAIKNVDEGIELLTGLKAGKKTKNNIYPKNTINYLVDEKLNEMAVNLRGFYQETKGGK